MNLHLLLMPLAATIQTGLLPINSPTCCLDAVKVATHHTKQITAQNPISKPLQFSDVAGDVYSEELQQAVAADLIAGFPSDNRLRPQALLTREQLVSLAVDVMQRVPLENTNIPFPNPNAEPKKLPPLPSQVAQNPFPDVSRDRWSAAKIEYARSLNLIRGYEDRTFRPAQPITRAEVVVLLQQLDRYVTQFREWDGREFFGGDPPLTFSDIQNHWARETINRMSANCRVASFLDEKGTAFAPNTLAKRNYGVAAVVRANRCLNILPPPPS